MIEPNEQSAPNVNQHMMMSSVNADDRIIGSVDKRAGHAGAGILHRAFSVFLIDECGRVVLQRRAAAKSLWPNFWSNSCCSHPYVAESGEHAVGRRIREELGSEAEDLQYLFKFQYRARFKDIGAENELCHVYVGRIRSESIDADLREVSCVAFLHPDVVTKSLAATPELFTPWMTIEWPYVRAHI